MKNQKDDFNKHLNIRLDEIKNSFSFIDCEEKYRFACGFLQAASVVVQDIDWSDMWGVMIEQEYLHKRNAIHENQDIYEDTPFD